MNINNFATSELFTHTNKAEAQPLPMQPSWLTQAEHPSFAVLSEIYEYFDGIADGAPDASYAAKMALQFSEPLKQLIEQLKKQ